MSATSVSTHSAWTSPSGLTSSAEPTLTISRGQVPGEKRLASFSKRVSRHCGRPALQSGDHSIASSPSSLSGTASGAGPSASTNLSSTQSTRSEEHTSELQSLMRISYAVFCLKKNKQQRLHKYSYTINQQYML